MLPWGPNLTTAFHEEEAKGMWVSLVALHQDFSFFDRFALQNGDPNTGKS